MLGQTFAGAASISASAPGDRDRPDYSIGTLVTDATQYRACLESFRAAGFTEPACEFLFADNTGGNAFDAYSGLNRILSRSRGRSVILCHQDILLGEHGRPRLDLCLADMDRLDPAWAVLGSAGGLPDGSVLSRMTDPLHPALPPVQGPARCVSVDEAFIVVRADANLGLSHDLSGFHLYGTDLCLIADTLGWTSWVIDFQLHHLSAGKMGPDFTAAREAIIQKYRRALRSRILATTCTTLPLTGSPVLSTLGRSSKGLSLWRRLLGRGN